MWVGGSSPSCGADDNDWVMLTDDNDMDVTNFTVDNNLSYDEVILDDGFGNQRSQTVRKIRMSIQGQLISDSNVTRNIGDIITIRNHRILPVSS